MNDDSAKLLEELGEIRACIFALLGVVLQIRRQQRSGDPMSIQDEMIDARQLVRDAKATLGI